MNHAPDGDAEDPPAQRHLTRSLNEQALTATASVEARHQQELEADPILQHMADLFGSLVYYAAQKLIDRKAKTGQMRARDEAVITSCSRLYNECFAGFILLKKGLILPATVLLRAAFETTTQAILFVEDENTAKEWLQGRRIPPREVRAKSKFAASERDLYTKLAGLSHPNLEAIRLHAVPVSGLSAIALSYGGYFAPKALRQTFCQFLFAELVLLEAFYSSYSEDLGGEGLLWRKETLNEIGGEPDMDWKTFFANWRRILTDQVSQAEQLSPDAVGIASHLESLAAQKRES